MTPVWIQSARALAATMALMVLSACATPAVQAPLVPPAGFAGPRLEADHALMSDGARLPLMRWLPEGEPRAVIVALHGMNDTRAAWNMAGSAWAAQGIITYAYDQRGFGGAPGRGVWAGEDLLAADLATLTRLVRARHPGLPLTVVGESMGGAVVITAFTSEQPPEAERVALLAPAVWGWSTQPLHYRASLWVAARLLGDLALEPPEVAVRNIMASDNLVELVRMSRDPGLITATRFDTLYGLVSLMEQASYRLSALAVPAAVFYGGDDQVITMAPMRRALSRAPEDMRTAFYPGGFHLLTRSFEGERVAADVAAFALGAMDGDDAAWPSGAQPFPGRNR